MQHLQMLDKSLSFKGPLNAPLSQQESEGKAKIIEFSQEFSTAYKH